MSKVEFKEFVKNNPKLLTYVKKDEMSWQKFYEMYDMYGTESEVWKPYLEEQIDESKKTTAGDFISYFRNLNLDNVQESINSIQRVLGVLGEIASSNKTESSSTYEPKPIYKHFDD